MNIQYYRNPYINIVAIKAGYFSEEFGEKYHLVADSYEFEPKWWKIVLMPHVKQGIIEQFLIDFETEKKRYLMEKKQSKPNKFVGKKAKIRDC